MDACLRYRSACNLKDGGTHTHDITQGILIKLFTQPKLTLMPQRRVAPTIRSLSSLSPVSNDKTAPGPEPRIRVQITKEIREEEDGLTISNTLMDFPSGMVWETGIMHNETELLEHLSNK